MVYFRRGRDRSRSIKPDLVASAPHAVPARTEPSLREVLRDPIIRSRMAADSVQIREILELAVAYREMETARKLLPVRVPILACTQVT